MYVVRKKVANRRVTKRKRCAVSCRWSKPVFMIFYCSSLKWVGGDSPVLLLPLNSTSVGRFDVVEEVVGKCGMLVGLVFVEVFVGKWGSSWDISRLGYWWLGDVSRCSWCFIKILSNELGGDSPVLLLPFNSVSMGHFLSWRKWSGKVGWWWSWCLLKSL